MNHTVSHPTPPTCSTSNTPIRIWDLPTRLFHWSLAALMVGLVVSGKVGGNAMVWHFRLGYAVLALLLFRAVWGIVGGRWSRFTAFLYSPARVLGYLRGQTHPHDEVGHSPTGALSVFALLGVLALQGASGLFSDDEIAFAGPLTRFVSGDWVGQATQYHKELGQYLTLGLVVLHILAVVFYVRVKRKNLLHPMLVGDKNLPHSTPASQDNKASRILALGVLALCSGVVIGAVRWVG